MEQIRREEIKSKEEYERCRPEFRRRIMLLKAKRRVPVGDHFSCHFETRDTMLYQVHEMLRAEDSWQREAAVSDELEAYNPLIPGGDELSATLMIAYQTPEERAHHLQRLLGLDRHVWLRIGEIEPVLAAFDQAQVSTTRISSVQYIRWPVDVRRKRLLRTEGTVVRLMIDHPHYSAQAVLSEETRKEIASDLG
jgi:hypothetical protein